ncbi:MAG: ABC transporter permease [bacterium]|nr:ABC transporter permease [Candidatus Sumerlaeota bacterium]
MRLLKWLMALANLVFQSMMLALGHIWGNKMRSLLTMLGIIIGVASVTSVIAALTGLKTKVLTEFEGVGTNKIFINPDRPETGPMRNASWWTLQFRPEMFDDLLSHCTSVSGFTRMNGQNDKVRHGGRNLDRVGVLGIEPAWHTIENRSVLQGRPFTALDTQEARYVCLINKVARDKLRLDRDCVGQSIFIGEYRYVVVGVVEPQIGGNLFGDSESSAEVFVPFTTARKINRRSMWVVAASKSPKVSEEARAELIYFMRGKRQIKPGNSDTFRVEAVQEFVDKFNQIALMITLVAAGVVGISLIVGGVGIMNIMLVSVSERTREIGLRKAVGARPSAILLQFLVEAVTLCFFGGLIGVLAGHGLAKLVAVIPGAQLEKASVPFWAIALSFGFSTAVGLLFGMFPAIKAARLDPIESLRHE